MNEPNIPEGWCTVKVINRIQYLCMPDGQIIPRQSVTVVKQNHDDARTGKAEVTITVRASLIDTKE